jgi:hypothetical protein
VRRQAERAPRVDARREPGLTWRLPGSEALEEHLLTPLRLPAIRPAGAHRHNEYLHCVMDAQMRASSAPVVTRKERLSAVLSGNREPTSKAENPLLERVSA